MRVALLAAALLTLSACAPTGRYQVVPLNPGGSRIDAVLLDTATGEAWTQDYTANSWTWKKVQRE